MVPAPSALGAVLQEQAAVLRPMEDGARWHYRYRAFLGKGLELMEVGQRKASDGGLVEVMSQELPTRPLTAAVSVNAQGHVRASGSYRLTPAATPVAYDSFELRSPVRVNEQIVVLDQRIEQSGRDVDGDGKIDPADVAIWRTVVGNEPVTLTWLAEPMTAVRVDTTTVVRFQPSGGGAAQSTTTQVSTWYAPQVGIVREATAGSCCSFLLDNDRTLVGYAHGDAGIGYTPMFFAEDWPVPSADFAATLKLPAGLLLAEPRGLRLVDPYGRPMAFHAFPDVSLLGQTGGTTWAMRRVTVVTDGVRYDLHRLAADGKPEAAPYSSFDPLQLAPRSEEKQTPRFAWAEGSGVLWAYWFASRDVSGTGVGQRVAVVRRHDGQELVGGEIWIPLGSRGYADTLQAVAQPDGLLLSWRDGVDQHVARVAPDGRVSAAPVVDATTFMDGFTLFDDGTGPHALWWGYTTACSCNRTHGVRLDSNGAMLGVAYDVTSLLNASLPGLMDRSGGLNAQRMTGYKGNWVYAEPVHGVVYFDEQLQRYHLDVRLMKVGSGAPTSDMKATARMRIPDLRPMTAPIVFDKHSLILTTTDGLMIPVVIWHR